MATTPKTLTYEEWLALPEVEGVEEVVNGEIRKIGGPPYAFGFASAGFGGFSNTRSERAEKLQDYESLGVPEVWVVSPEAETVEILLLQDGRLATTSLVRHGQLKPTHFPDAAVDVSLIWPK